MAEIRKIACAGTDEKSDFLVEIAPYDNGIVLELQSVVKNQYGADIEKAVREVLQSLGIENAYVKANDRGALDPVLRARVETAAKRAMED